VKDICEEPGCGRAAIIGLNGVWLCLVDFDKRLTAEKARRQEDQGDD
jgi:hypothetical protein